MLVLDIMALVEAIVERSQQKVVAGVCRRCKRRVGVAPEEQKLNQQINLLLFVLMMETYDMICHEHNTKLKGMTQTQFHLGSFQYFRGIQILNVKNISGRFVQFQILRKQFLETQNYYYGVFFFFENVSFVFSVLFSLSFKNKKQLLKNNNQTTFNL